MSTHKLTQKRRWISFLILVQLMTLLLPVHRVSAADQQVVIPKEKVDAMVFQLLVQRAINEGTIGIPANSEATAGTFEAQGSDDDLPYIRMTPPEHEIYQELIIQGANMDILEIELWEKYKKALIPRGDPDYDVRVKKSYDEVIFTMLDVARGIPELRPHVTNLWKTLAKAQYDRTNPLFLRKTHVSMSVARYGKARALKERAPQVINQIYQAAQTNPEMARAADIIFGEVLDGGSVKDFDGKGYIDEHPDDPALDGIPETRGDGSMSVSLEELYTYSREQFNAINAGLDDLQSTIGEISDKQDVLIDYVNNQQQREQMQAMAAAKAAEHRLKMEAIQSSLFIAYTLADVIDPEFAMQLSVVGNSTLQVYESLNGWMTAVAGLGTLDKVGSLSTLVMTGNVLGSVMNVVSLFGSSGPTVDQMILEEIGKLRQQVDQLRTEMHSRFDRIDEELNTIYATMQSRFDLIDVQLGKLNGKLDEVQQALIGLDLKLSRIERNNFEFLDALGRRPLLEAINGGLGYQERTGEPMPYQPEFVNFENQLQGWGTIHAFDPLSAGPTQRDYTPLQVYSELNAYPLDSNINYLNGWLATKGIPTISNERIASPRDWLFATRAYTELGVEWPAHMLRIDPQRQAALNDVGTDIEVAMHKISTLDTVSGTVGNTLLFSNVITYYQGTLNQLDVEIQKEEAAFVHEVGEGLHPGMPFALYGGFNQELTYKTPEVTTMTCGDANVHGSYPAPNNLSTRIPNFNLYNLAEYMGLGSFSACLSDEWLNEYEHCDVDHEPPFETICHMRGDHKAVLTVYFNDVAIMRQSNLGGDEAISDDILKSRWTINQYKQLFEMLPADQPTPEQAAQQAANASEVTADLEERFEVYQHALYDRIKNKMLNGSLHDYAVILAGGKTLLDSFVTLGFSRAVAEDELLHAMLYGNQQLMDDSQIIQSYAMSATQPIDGPNLLVNQSSVLRQVAAERLAAFNALLGQYLDAITAQTHVEAADYTISARQDLALTMSLAVIDEPPTTPEVPTTPETPGTPGTPTTPEIPGTPVTPVPPTTPTTPTTPEAPATPVPPTTEPPNVPSDGEKKLLLPLISG